jgi:hypothetical protein
VVDPFLAVITMRERPDMVSDWTRFLAVSTIDAASWAFTKKIPDNNITTKIETLFILYSYKKYFLHIPN